ncbi:MAG TPA: 3-deoxy-D-manno-octulosonic acid transferase [Pseudolabrys sp.]|nr:3-deoxy-D-manno-octulosonic acid transferase [Pseudolabrys sp.]
MSGKLPAGLRIYRLLSAAAGPFTPILLARRLKRGKEHRRRLSERRGESRIVRPEGPLVWLHGASVGELASVLPLIDRIRARGMDMLITTGTVTSGGLAEQRLHRGVIHQFMPLDISRFVRRFLDHWQPDLALFVESELWPNMMVEASARSIPMVLINARLSEHSFKRWRRVPNSIASLLRRLDLCLAGTSSDAARLAELGASNVVTTGNLKLDVPAPPADPTALAMLQDAIGGRPVIAAASTHAGEEGVIIEAHTRLSPNFPDLLTLIAPRHPNRGPSIAEIAAGTGLSATLRSRGELPTRATQIYVVDTVGELGLVYRLASAVFIGGSLVRHGGQNPVEAAKLRAAILHGPHVWNFSEIYAALDNAHAGELIEDVDRLTAHFAAWLADPNACARVSETANVVVGKLGGALDRTLVSLDPYLMQLQLRQRAHHA